MLQNRIYPEALIIGISSNNPGAGFGMQTDEEKSEVQSDEAPEPEVKSDESPDPEVQSDEAPEPEVQSDESPEPEVQYDESPEEELGPPTVFGVLSTFLPLE